MPLDLENIEKRAKDMGYFNAHLGSYEALRSAIHERKTLAKGDAAKEAYWSLLSKMGYFIFETLWSAFEITQKQQSQDSTFHLLPNFMSRYCSLLDVNEFIKTLMAVYEVPQRELRAQDDFGKAVKDKRRHGKKDTLLQQFIQKHPVIAGKYESKKSHKDLRHFFVHRLRPLW